MTGPDTDAALVRAKIEQFIPDGFRDEDGVWHRGPHGMESLAALDRLTAALQTAQQERDAFDAWLTEWRDRAERAERELETTQAEFDALDQKYVREAATVTRLREAIQRARTDIGLTVYEGTPVSVSSGKRIEKDLAAALAQDTEQEPA